MSAVLDAARRDLEPERLLRPLLLDSSVYAELLREPSTAIARVLLLTSAVAALSHVVLGVGPALTMFVAALVLWGAALGIVRYLATSDVASYGLRARDPNLGELAVVLAYANVPRSLLALVAIPLASGHFLAALVLAAAVLALTVAAFSQAINALLDVDPRSAGTIALVANTPWIFSYLLSLIIA